MVSRRGFSKLLAGAAAGWSLFETARAANLRTSLRLDKLLLGDSFSPGSTQERHYRADVSVAVLGIPIFSREGVGKGFASIREGVVGCSCSAQRDGPASRRLVAMQFAGGSIPERAHGIEYCGSMEEVAEEENAALARTAYFGFLTARPDESLEEAKRSLKSEPRHLSFIAAEGQHEAGRIWSRRAAIELAGRCRDLRELIGRIRAGFAEAKASDREAALPGAPAPAFLYAMLGAIRSREDHHACGYVDNGSPYRLESRKTREADAGAAFVAKNLTLSAAAVTRLSGQIHDAETRRTTAFRLWFDDSSELPLRIEFQARSYLRIALEFDPVRNA